MEGTMTERIQVNGLPAEASFTAGGDLRWRVDGGAGRGEQSLAVESSVLGFTAEGREITVRAFVSQLKGPFCGVGNLGNRVMKNFVLEMPTEVVAKMWSERLRKYIDSLGRPKRIFIFLNPYGGKKSARKIFHTEIRPLLLAANIIYTLQETEYQLHAQELAYKLDFLNYDGIVCVSGDGVLVEVVNGLLQREDWDTAIKVPLGIIPAGTGNGLAKSILDAAGENYSIQNATFAVIRGHKRALDVTTVLQGNTKFFSILMLSWGLIADIDIESEKYRWMGDTRLDFYCILRVMKLRKYHGNIEYIPAPGHESFGKPKNEREAIAGNIEISKQGRDGDVDVLHGYQGPNCCFDDSVWRFLEGPFISIMLVNVPWVGKDAMPAPEAKFSDGFLDLVLIKDCPKSALASILLKTGNGSHVKSPYVMYLKVKAFRLVPGNRVGDSAKGGIVDVDGEVVARGEGVYMCGQERDPMSYGPPILLTVDKGLATVFSSR
ncbi:sphingosine kinase 2-like isoform X1 [Dendrobium catenatum]|uniref:sphingosine kinase n=1 Tax=Dendrobium catenatum TaxID=906689 RepID=A0A2I0X9N1_9ASPA|nr:sphingosine kinase 2-like isoform X1 [Dendrobium catenatum]XP_028548877.1 sphingosine kinase 2-like isoform X1 [Dendrobium catenatum]XP_028548878.1 sphingosine kinase 2-like isoform X1 [Dendrobium catenatum]PKU84606.1 Sphingosine kinase 2 [Dendrobium catenatum]